MAREEEAGIGDGSAGESSHQICLDLQETKKFGHKSRTLREEGKFASQKVLTSNLYEYCSEHPRLPATKC